MKQLKVSTLQINDQAFCLKYYKSCIMIRLEAGIEEHEGPEVEATTEVQSEESESEEESEEEESSSESSTSESSDDDSSTLESRREKVLNRIQVIYNILYILILNISVVRIIYFEN